MDVLYDVAIVGAGPAGSAAALRVLQLRPGARVVMLDAATFPRDKTCGDGIAAHVFDLLDALGVRGLADSAPAVPRLRFRTATGRVAERACARPNRVIRREVFDAALVDAAVSRGALLRRHRVRTLEVRDDRVVLDSVVAARTVIGAGWGELRGAPTSRRTGGAAAVDGARDPRLRPVRPRSRTR